MFPHAFYPFRGGDASATFRNLLDSVLQEIDQLENDYVLNASATELEKHYISRASITPLNLHADQPYIEGQRGVNIDVSDDFARVVFPGKRAHVRGTQVEITIPCEGDSNLWRVCPNPFALSGYPEISVHDDRVTFTVSFPDDSTDAERTKREINTVTQALAGAVTSLQKNVASHNAEAVQRVKERLAIKREKALASTQAVSGLGIPMKRRDQPATYVAPVRRRETPIRRPTAAVGKYAPEPILPEEEYLHILSVLGSMALVIERNPDSFKLLNEESIRDHFLIQLNGHYEGSATGETFNRSGKTDILIRAENKNIFIAECKFWDGPKKFDHAIYQLLDYLTWRDCKCALLIFNRTGDSGGVAQKVHEVMTHRPEHRRTVTHDLDGKSRYVLVKKEEPGREIIISTLIFEIPGK